MRIRGLVKWLLLGATDLSPGRFRYFGHNVYFPSKSHLFKRVCDEGIYENETLRLIACLVQRHTTYIDVGANIGLLSVPILALCPTARVLSIEASPQSVKCLRKTHAEAPRRESWQIIASAVGAETAAAEFWVSRGEYGAFDGLRNTGRGGPKQEMSVMVRTLDDIWVQLGRPEVSVVKLDIEGAESLALQGARVFLSSQRPIIVIEWAEANLEAYEIPGEFLIDLCNLLKYKAYAFPSLVAINEATILRLAMMATQTFVLVPTD